MNVAVSAEREQVVRRNVDVSVLRDFAHEQASFIEAYAAAAATCAAAGDDAGLTYNAGVVAARTRALIETLLDMQREASPMKGGR